MKINEFKKRRCSTLAFMIISILLVLAGCSTVSPELGPTPDVAGYGKYPAFTEPFTYHNMNCSMITDVSKGYSWSGITIGRTTYEEIIKIINPEQVVWNPLEGNIAFLGEGYRLETCFIGDTVSALKLFLYNGFLVSDRGYETIYDYVDEFGKPDLITWGRRDERTVLWAKEGIIASVLTRDDAAEGKVEGVVLISPFNPLWANQWVLDAVAAAPPKRCVFGSEEEGYSYDGDTSCCPDPFFDPDSDDCGIIEGYDPEVETID